jgi:putative acetyltransferase
MVPMPSPEIVEYSKDDQNAFAELVNGVHAEFGFTFDPGLDADLTSPDAFYHRIWVLKRGDEVVGSVALTPARRGTTILKRMYLRREIRGQGWGRRLLYTAVQAAERDGCNRILLDTSEIQHSAQQLYERAGFRLDRREGGKLFYSMDL